MGWGEAGRRSPPPQPGPWALQEVWASAYSPARPALGPSSPLRVGPAAGEGAVQGQLGLPSWVNSRHTWEFLTSRPDVLTPVTLARDQDLAWGCGGLGGSFSTHVFGCACPWADLVVARMGSLTWRGGAAEGC